MRAIDAWNHSKRWENPEARCSSSSEEAEAEAEESAGEPGLEGASGRESTKARTSARVYADKSHLSSFGSRNSRTETRRRWSLTRHLRQNATQDESVDGIAGDARVDVDDGVDDLHHQSERTTVLNVKGRTTEDGLEDGDADAPDVGFGSASRFARGEALRGHVDDGTVETPRRRRSRIRGGAQSEIAEFTRPRFVEQDVARFDVAMDDRATS